MQDIREILSYLATTKIFVKNAREAGRVFEIFIATGIAGELKDRGYDVWLQRSDGTRILSTNPQFIQRAGVPSGISPAAEGPDNATSIVFSRTTGESEWELLNGIQFTGRSAADHEIDIAIIPKSVADALRALPQGGKPRGRPRVAIECKYVRSPGKPDEMRALVARLYDLTLLDGQHQNLRIPGAPKAIHPNAPEGAIHEPAYTYMQENKRTYNALVRCGGLTSNGAVTLGCYYAVRPFGGIMPGTENAKQLVRDVATWIDANI